MSYRIIRQNLGSKWHKKAGRVCRTKGEHWSPHSPFHSLYQPPSPSVILSIPSVPSPLSGSVQSLADADKRMLPVMDKDQRSRLSGGGVGRRCRGGRASVLERHCQSCGRPLFFLGSLLIRRLPRSSLLSLRSSSVHLFLGLWLLLSSLKRGNVTAVWHEALLPCSCFKLGGVPHWEFGRQISWFCCLSLSLSTCCWTLFYQ